MDLANAEDIRAPHKSGDRLEKARTERLARIREMGIEPYGGRYDDTEAACDVKRRFKDEDERQQARCAGRIPCAIGVEPSR